MRGEHNKEKEPQTYLKHIYANFSQRNASALCFLCEKHRVQSLLLHKLMEKDSVRSDYTEANCSLKMSLEERLLETTTVVDVGPMISLLVNFGLSLQDQACILSSGNCLRSQSQSSWSPQHSHAVLAPMDISRLESWYHTMQVQCLPRLLMPLSQLPA